MGFDLYTMITPDGANDRRDHANAVRIYAAKLKDALTKTIDDENGRPLIVIPDENTADHGYASTLAELAWGNVYDANPAHFRAGFSKMYEVVDAMVKLGMAYRTRSDDGCGFPAHPIESKLDNPDLDDTERGVMIEEFNDAVTHAEVGKTSESDTQMELGAARPIGDIDPDVMDMARRYAEACHAVRVHHPDGADTIPTHKFSDNSGWIVTPDECSAALAAYGRNTISDVTDATSDVDSEMWQRWITYLTTASNHGGFQVY